MNLTKRIALPLALLVLASTAQAAPATQEEAQRLTKLAEIYLGTPKPGEPPSVTVVPDGESYKATLDIARLANGILAPFDAKVVASEPYSYELTPLADGTWHVTQKGSPQLGFNSAKGFTYSVQLKDTTLDGIFDPKLMSFTKSVFTQAGSRTSIDDGKVVQHTDMTSESRDTFTSKGESAAAVDTTGHFSSKGVRYTFDQSPSSTAKEPPATPAISGTARMDTLGGDLVMDGQKAGPMYDLWAFLVAHPSKETLTADQVELKRRLVALLPFATRVSGTAQASGMVANAAGLDFSIGSFAEKVSFGDPEPLAFALKLDGLKLPEALTQGAMASLAPTSLDLKLSVSPLNISGALRQIIDHMDLTQDPPVDPDTFAAALTTLQGGGEVTVKLAPSTVSNAIVTVTAEGSAIASPVSPSGHLVVKARGLEKEIAMLRSQAEGDPTAAQAVQTLTGLAQLARQGDDGSLVWNLTAAPGGDVLVNGTPLGLRSSAPKAQPEEQPAPEAPPASGSSPAPRVQHAPE